MITAEQRAERIYSLGGSDAAAALNLNPYKSRMALWMEKVGLQEIPDLDDVEHVYWGNVLEDVIAREWARRCGKEIRRHNATLAHPERSWMTANIDRRVTGEKAVLECKNLNAWKGANMDQPLDEHVVQVAHYLCVTGFDRGYIAYLVGGNRLEWFTVEADPGLLNMVYSLESDFWRHVETKTPPPIVHSDEIALLYQTSQAVAMNATEDLYLDAIMLRGYVTQIKELEEKAEEIKERIKLALVDHDTLLWEGKPIATWKTSKASRRLDAKALGKNHPELVEQYTKETPGARPFLLKV